MKFANWVILACAMASAAPALGRGAEPYAVAAIAPDLVPGVDTLANPLASQLDFLMLQRAGLMNRLSPEPAIDGVDPVALARRLSALHELDKFLRDTVAGLAAAADNQPDVRKVLASVAARHEEGIAAAFAKLLAHPLVREEGWFVISRFGAKADRDAGELAAAVGNPILRRDIVAKLEALAQRGETACDTARLKGPQASTIP